jgi:hypothetical protein
VLLVLANVFFFAWARGWLVPMWPPPRAGEREPERLQAQVFPDNVRVLGAAATVANAGQPGAATAARTPATPSAPSAAAGTPQCLEAGPFAAAELGGVAAALVQAGVPATAWTRVPSSNQGWLVYAGRFADVNARRTMLQDWRRLGLSVDLMDSPPEWAPGLVLSSHPSKEAAEVALSGLPGSVSQVSRVVPTPAAAQPSVLRVPSADASLAARLLALPAPLQGSFKPCTTAR